MEFIDNIVNAVVHGGIRMHITVLLICLFLGIRLLQWEFKLIFKLLARKDEYKYELLKDAFTGIPTLLGVTTGIWWTTKFLAIPPRVLEGLKHLNRTLFIITVALFIAHFISGFLKYKMGRSSSKLGSTSILVTTIDVAVYTIALLVLLESFGISISPVVTALGVGGLASALALQDTLANLFSGINTLLSKQVKIGDFVKLSTGESGHIVDMNWRNTTIKTITENMIVVPNQKIASSVIVNYAQPYASCSILIPVGVSYDSDLDYVEKVTLEVAKKVLEENDGGADEGFEPQVRFRELGGFSVDFDVVLRVKSVMDQRFIRHQFIKAIYKRYKEEGIEIPTNPLAQSISQ